MAQNDRDLNPNVGEKGINPVVFLPGLGSESDDNSDETNTFNDAENVDPEGLGTRVLSLLKNITVEPAIIGSMYMIVMYSMLAKEYIYMRIAMDYNLTATDRANTCNGTTVNKSDPDYILQQKVSSETSKWILYLNISDFVVALFSTILLGSWSDKVGRKIPMLISHFGLFMLVVTYVIVVNLNLPVPVLLIGHFFCGLCGDLGNVLGSSFAYIADITKRHQRTLRMTVIETCIGLGGFVASISGGVWVDASGFRDPFWFLLAVTAFNFVYIAFRLPSTHQGKWVYNLRHLFTKEPFVHMYHVLKPQPDDKKRHLNLLLHFSCFLIISITTSGVKDILVIYEIGLPFCWDALFVGISLAIGQLGYFVSVVLVKIFPGVSSELKLVVVGAISNASSCAVLAFAQYNWMIFLGMVLQLCFNLPSPIIRSQISKLVAPHELGSVFALLSCAHDIGNLMASFLFNPVFSATVNSVLPGAAFLIGTGLFGIFVPLYWWVFKRSKASMLNEEMRHYDELSDNEE